jgi:selenide, water dikinase
LSQKALAQVLRRIPQVRDPKLLVGSATADDAGVYRIDRNRALVQTVDFFTPIVDDPYLYGQIAATNSLSDVYAMGGRPLTAMSLLGVPADVVPPDVINAILRGGGAKAKQARCVMVGGHSIRNPEPIYGLSVTGLVSPRRLITNADARPGDLLVLTKPLGTGILTTGIKRGLTTPAGARRAIRSMSTLNTPGAELAERGLVRAGTDITGFGLLGHLTSLCKSSGVSAELNAASVPALGREVFDLIARDCVPGGTRENLKTVSESTAWAGVSDAQKFLLADAQTSGGLLLCVPPRKIEAVQAILKGSRTLCAAVIGAIVRKRRPLIRVQA